MTVIIAGSPRKGMYSDRIAERFAGLTDAEIIYARNLRIGPCRACGYCKGAGNGTCVQKDDMPSVLESIRTSDGIALISPVYWWQTTAQIKLVIDRLYALRDGELKGKKLAVIMNGEAEDSDAEYRILSEQTANINSTDELIKNVVDSFFATYSRNLGEFQKVMEEEELPDDTLLMNELSETKKELEKLGTVNYLAEDDYNAAKEQFDFYAKHLDDLNKARIDLEKVLTEIEDKAKELFLQTYTEISDNFQSMFTRLFGGGVAKLTLEDPENVLTSGIDIFAQPPGKKLVTLSLLSGGERSMTAVALLFATYQVKPSPFCILDELDAALDDKNVGFFLDVLADFGESSQFIIITHNKHTVTGAETLLGVTQEEKGVSKTVSYRLGRVEGKPVILNDDDTEAEFDSEGRRL